MSVVTGMPKADQKAATREAVLGTVSRGGCQGAAVAATLTLDAGCVLRSNIAATLSCSSVLTQLSLLGMPKAVGLHSGSARRLRDAANDSAGSCPPVDVG